MSKKQKSRSGAKRIQGIDRYNPVIDAPIGYSREEVMTGKDNLHRRMFPEKYDEQGNRISD